MAGLLDGLAAGSPPWSRLRRFDISRGTATESLRLIDLRYQAGESTALEVVDAQNTLTAAGNNYHDGEARYHLALANLQTLTGTF